MSEDDDGNLARNYCGECHAEIGSALVSGDSGCFCEDDYGDEIRACEKCHNRLHRDVPRRMKNYSPYDGVSEEGDDLDCLGRRVGDRPFRYGEFDVFGKLVDRS